MKIKWGINTSAIIANRVIRKLKLGSWDNYVSSIEHVCHGAQVVAYKIMKLSENNITEKDWLMHCQNLWRNTEVDDNPALLIPIEVEPIEIDELNSTLETFNLQE